MPQVPVAKVATAYDHPNTGETFILIFGQALYLGDKLQHNLICPNQARYNGVVIDDVPRHLSHDGKSTHSIYFPDDNIQLPLKLRGIILYIDTRYPTQWEIDNCRWLIVTSNVEWEPYDDSFEEREQSCQDTDPNHPYLDRELYALHSQSLGDSDVASRKHRHCQAIALTGRKLLPTDKQIADIFHCSPEVATRTRQVTTQMGIRNVVGHLTRRFCTKLAALRYDQLGGRHRRFYSDTLFSSVKSIQGNTMGQIFVNDIGYTHFVPIKAKAEAPYALQEFIQDVGIPSSIHTDEAKELTIGIWREICRSHSIKQTLTEPHSPFQNRAEVNIRELKKLTRAIMQQTQTTRRLWDLCASYVAELRTITAKPLSSLHGRTPFELVTGNTPDILEYITFSWFQPVWYYDNTTFPEPTRHVARWIGVAHNVGQAMCFWLLPVSGIPIARTSAQAISEHELRDPVVIETLREYDASIQKTIRDNTLNESHLTFEIGSSELLAAL